MVEEDEEEIYRYVVPLETEGNTSTPAYDPTYKGETLVCRYKSNVLVIVQTEATPHFHKDSVNVKVEEVDREDFE